MTNMKSKLHLSAGVLLLLALSLAHSSAQTIDPRTGQPIGAPGGATIFDPTTGRPVVNIPGPRGAGFLGVNPAPDQSPPVAFDPATGAPIPPPPPLSWKDTNWTDPDIVLSKVSYADLPLSEVARTLRADFKDKFDILLPAPTTGNNAFNDITGLPQPDTDWGAMMIQLELRNVTASEVFNAMNLIFENNQTPLRWELRVNGHRQIAVLHVLIRRNANYNPFEPREGRKVFFVGDLIGDEKNGGMSMQEIIKTVTDVWKMTGDSGGKIQFHEDAQLLVVSGSSDQIDFMTQTLAALRQKVDQAHEAHAQAKTGGGGGGGGSQTN